MPVPLGVIEIEDLTGNISVDVQDLTKVPIEGLRDRIEAKIIKIETLQAIPLDVLKISPLYEENRLSLLLETSLANTKILAAIAPPTPVLTQYPPFDENKWGRRQAPSVRLLLHKLGEP